MELPHAQAPSSVCSRCPRAACVIELCVMQSYIEPLYTIRVDKNSVNSGHSHPPRWAIGGQNNTQNPNIRIYKIDEPPPLWTSISRGTSIDEPPLRARIRHVPPRTSISPVRPFDFRIDEPPVTAPLARIRRTPPGESIWAVRRFHSLSSGTPPTPPLCTEAPSPLVCVSG